MRGYMIDAGVHDICGPNFLTRGGLNDGWGQFQGLMRGSLGAVL